MRLLRSLLLSSFLGCLCAAQAEAKDKVPCKMIDETTLSLHAEIKKGLIDCVRALDISKLDTVVLDSGGGDVEAAMIVGDLIAPYHPHMIIKKRCHSSCSNYWLPLARKITFSKKARILIHGGIDPAVMARAEKREGEKMPFVQRLIDLQDDYLLRHNIPRGWVMYRTNYLNGTEAFKPWLAGELSVPKGSGPVRNYMVTAPMLYSCLKGIELDGFEKSYAARADKFRWESLRRRGKISTGTLACPSAAD